MARKTKAFSYDDKDQVWFDKLKAESRAHKPKTSESAMLVHILRTHFEHKKMLDKMVSA